MTLPSVTIPEMLFKKANYEKNRRANMKVTLHIKNIKVRTSLF